jgi:cell division cycle protein 37
MGFMLLKCLHLEMAGDRRGMLRTAKTGYALKSIMDFADAGKKQMKDAGRPFFTRLAEDDKVFKDYTDAYDDYCEKLKERAVVKKTEEATAKEKLAKEIDDAESLEEIPREQRLGPGGLDPVEVFESLPKEMQDAFESGNVDTLRDFVNKLPMNEAKLYMKRMVDSGLWVATPGQEGTALQDGDDDEDE